MLALIIITLGILSRLVIHTPNFTPVLSLAFLAGIYLESRQAIWVPLALVVLSDCILGFYPLMIVTWASILLISIIGLCLKNHKSLMTVFAGSILSAVLFFVTTNFASWLSLYPHTMAGFKQCYILAIPFFRSSLASTVAYSIVFYAGYEWLLKKQHTPQGNLV